jgi:colanic acid/amylovoran biosynthesis glycosyltransferase
VALSPEELKQLYQESHLFVLPSVSNPGGHVETQGVVLQEAQASGCVPIASNVGGVPECVNDNKDALLVRQKSSRDLAEKIETFYFNPQCWAAYQNSGRQNVQANLSANVIGLRMAEILRGRLA